MLINTSEKNNKENFELQMNAIYAN